MKSAVIGLGVIGNVHMQVLQSGGHTVAAVCDIDESRFSAYPDIPHYTDYRKMLREVEPDVVHVCTPHYLHAEMICEALDRGVNVLCEKPVCIHGEEITRILEAERRSKAQLGVCLQNRYNAANRYVKDYLRGKKVVEGSGTVVWHRDEAYYASGDWRGKWKTEGGGVLINQALHTLDLLEWLIGTPEYVSAFIGNLSLQNKIEVEDTACAIYSGGAEFSFFATNGGRCGLPVEITLRTEDSDYVKLLPDSVTVNGETKRFDRDTRIYGKYCYGTGHERLIEDFYSCVARGEKFEIDGEEGAKVVRLILGAYESRGRKIKL